MIILLLITFRVKQFFNVIYVKAKRIKCERRNGELGLYWKWSKTNILSNKSSEKTDREREDKFLRSN